MYLNRFLVVATKDELSLPAALELLDSGTPAVVTGVGGTNVIQSLSFFPRDCEIVNVGYCGSRSFGVGDRVEISDCMLYHPNCSFSEQTFHIGQGNARCLTAGDFVQDAVLNDGTVVDMELAYIAAMGFKNIKSIKYVSDKLDYGEYERTLGRS